MEIVLLDDKCKPTKSHNTDSGYDLYITEEVIVEAHETKIISSGFKMKLPQGTTAIIKPRSSVFKRGVNVDGVIDQDYTGEIGIMLQNTNDYSVSFKKYERVAQMIILKYVNENLEVTDKLKETIRGTSGFGSSGRL